MLKHFTWNTVSGPKSLAIISTAMALKWHHSKAESEEELQSLDESKEESEKVGLKLNIKKTKIMASGPITSWQIGGETGNSERLYFWGLQNHCDGDCRYEIKRYLLLGRKPRQHITKQRHYFANKGPFSQSYGFSSNHKWMWETTKKAECWRTDVFELWCWRRLLRVPWTARRCNQSILKEINPEYSLEGLMLKLKLWYFDHLMWSTDSFEKTLMLGKIEGGRRRGQQRRR